MMDSCANQPGNQASPVGGRRTRSLDRLDTRAVVGKANFLSPASENVVNSHELRISPPISLAGSPSEISLLNLSGNANRSLGCEMCANYEHRLQQLQESERHLRQKVNTWHNLAERYNAELSSERQVRGELEVRVDTLNQSLSDQFASLTASLKKTEERQARSQELAKKNRSASEKQLNDLMNERHKLDEQLKRLRDQYDRLLGRHRETADQMQREAIDLPQSIDSLQLMALQLREELIEERAAREHVEESLKSEMLFLRDQMLSEQNAKDQMEQSLYEEINSLRTELGVARSRLAEEDELKRNMADCRTQMDVHRTTINGLESNIETAKKEKLAAESVAREYRQKANMLQQELDNCEQVQKDFVRLSQSLQIELEKIRQADNEVRWQDEDDVLVCNGCKQPFNKQRRKGHCRHCGRIFCESCLSKTVPSGPQHKPAIVCDVCHTLLVRYTAPYFSSHVPSSNST